MSAFWKSCSSYSSKPRLKRICASSELAGLAGGTGPATPGTCANAAPETRRVLTRTAERRPNDRCEFEDLVMDSVSNRSSSWSRLTLIARQSTETYFHFAQGL